MDLQHLHKLNDLKKESLALKTKIGKLEKSDPLMNSGARNHQKAKALRKKQKDLHNEFKALSVEYLPEFEIETDDPKLKETLQIIRAFYFDWKIKPTELQYTINSLGLKILACNFKKDRNELWFESLYK